MNSRDVLFAESFEALYSPSVDSLVFSVAGSMVPFALRWMHAELPHRNGQTATTIERLYALLEFCNSKVSNGFLQVLVDLSVNRFS